SLRTPMALMAILLMPAVFDMIFPLGRLHDEFGIGDREGVPFGGRFIFDDMLVFYDKLFAIFVVSQKDFFAGLRRLRRCLGCRRRFFGLVSLSRWLGVVLVRFG